VNLCGGGPTFYGTARKLCWPERERAKKTLVGEVQKGGSEGSPWTVAPVGATGGGDLVPTVEEGEWQRTLVGVASVFGKESFASVRRI